MPADLRAALRDDAGRLRIELHRGGARVGKAPRIVEIQFMYCVAELRYVDRKMRHAVEQAKKYRVDGDLQACNIGIPEPAEPQRGRIPHEHVELRERQVARRGIARGRVEPRRVAALRIAAIERIAGERMRDFQRGNPDVKDCRIVAERDRARVSSPRPRAVIVETKSRSPAMSSLNVNGCPINYVVEGSGAPVMLIHGFASSLQGNWRAPGVIDAIVAAGRQVIAFDCRGHGRSGKPHDPQAYAGSAMAADAIALLDHLGIAQADLAGYSMGGLLSATLLVNHPLRWRSVVISGMGDVLLTGNLPSGQFDTLVAAMEAPDTASIKDARGRAFRQFAQASGNDLLALAAMHKVRRSGFDPAKLAEVKIPVLILIGDKDGPEGAKRLAQGIPGATFVEVPGDHLGAVSTPEFRRAIVDWLTR